MRDKLLKSIVLFFYLFSIQFVFVPMGIGTRVLFGIIGVALLPFIKRKNESLIKIFFTFSIVLLLMMLYTLFAVIYNMTNDYHFIEYSISLITIVLSCFFVMYVVNTFTSYRDNYEYFYKISEMIIYLVLFQNVLAVIMFLVPALKSLLESLQVFTQWDIGLLDEVLEFRLVGFGVKFFAFGIVNGFALILIATVLKFYRLSRQKFISFFLFYVAIFVLGMMAARTTIIGFLLSAVILLNPHIGIKYSRIFKIRIALILMMCLFLVSVVFSIVLNGANLSQFENIFEFGFDLIFNFLDSGDAKSESLSQLSNMYIWPEELKTYIIGDGKFVDERLGTYYMRTDVGWIRLIYYFGIPGMFLYVLTHLFILKYLYQKYPRFLWTFIVLMLYFIILNFKGFTDILYLLFPFLFFDKNKVSYEKEV